MGKIDLKQKYYQSKEWGVFFDVLSNLEKQLLWAVARKSGRVNTAASIAGYCFSSESTLLPYLKRFCEWGVVTKTELSKERISYQIDDRELVDFLQGLPPSQIFDTHDLINSFGNSVYNSAAVFYENLEHYGLIYGNGHHCAQQLSSLARSIATERIRN